MLGGFAEVMDGQRAFRGVLDAMAHPGRVSTLPAPLELPPPLMASAAAVCLTLLDFETPLWIDDGAARPEVMKYLRFHCGVPLVAASEASTFALIADPAGMPPIEAFPNGTDEYPDRSATLIVQVADLRPGAGWRLTGPGIDGEVWIALKRVPHDFWSIFWKNRASFP
jgi:alpha-D-ribose 1-methylphosphonate 5-triphosphate synthase subunit PhnH